MALTPGQTLGRYRIVDQLGAGGMGVVYRAFDEKLGRNLAIKVLAAGLLDDEAARKRFRNEARVLSRLNHPSIQTIHDFDTIDGSDLLITELVEGTSLDERVRAGALPEKDVVRYGVQMAQGLAAAHGEGVLHRDLKPSNLRVTADGRLKILDFGLATLANERMMTLSTVTGSLADAPSGVAGTLPYMSPEQLLGEKVDERSDIYSAGVVLFELATGRLPFAHTLVPKLTNAILHEPPPEPRSAAPKLSEQLEQVILRCLEKDPELRYQSAKDLAADLRRLELGSSRTAVRLPARTRGASPRWAIVLLPVLVLIAVIAGILWRRRAAEQDTAAVPSLRWTQLTNFNDAALVPTLSPDGKVVAFLRGAGTFGSSASLGQIWVKTLPDGEPVQVTKTPLRKHTLAFSPDGTRLYFTQVLGAFTWNTYDVPLLGTQEPNLFMANATGLNWIGKDQLMFSSIKHGIHMALVTSSLNRTNARDIYVPPDQDYGMAHRSALSPDGKNVLVVEMDTGWWRPCRLVPFDGSSPGRRVGPEGSCTAAQWSPDGKWMYFTVDSASTGFHLWRQRFPDGIPQQLTPSGASEEEGIAIAPDGRSLITAAGTQQSAIWLHNDSGDRQLTSEGYTFLPSLSPDGAKVYYLRRVAGSRSYISGELWVSDVASGNAERMFPGLVVSQYAISRDGKKVVFATEPGQPHSGIWIADLDRTQPPRQLTEGGEYRVYFGKPGEIIYQGIDPLRIMHMKDDGTERRALSSLRVLQIQQVSPDGHWAIIGVAPPEGHGDRNTMAMLLDLGSGQATPFCPSCSFGYGTTRTTAPFVQWSPDSRTLYVSLWYFGNSNRKTAVVPFDPKNTASILGKFESEDAVAKLPGARLLDLDSVFPGGPGQFVSMRISANTNLFRVDLPQ